MIDGVGSTAELSRKIIAHRSGKVKGVRINSRRDQITRGEPELVQVDVPRHHPLFNL